MTALSKDIGTGAYLSGRGFIAVWSMVDGHPRCIDAPLPLATASPAQLAAVIARNQALAALCARAEAAEAAQWLTAQPEPPAQLDIPDQTGTQMVQIPNPAHQAWMEAATLLADVATDAAMGHLLRTRSDSLERDEFGFPTEEPFELALPPVPAIVNPLAQTADWNGEAWQVRDLTEAERPVWPLRPAPTLGKSAFAQVLRGAVGDALAVTVLTTPEINLTLTLAGQVDWTDIFASANGGPGYAQQLIDAGIVTSAHVAALREAWPLSAGN